MKPGRLQERMEAAANRLAKSVSELQEQWLGRNMERVMPPEIYALSLTAKKNQKDRAKLALWVSDNKIETRQYHDGRIHLVKNDVVISEFAVRFREGKAEVMVKDHPYEALES